MDEIVSEFLAETSESMVELDNLMVMLEHGAEDAELISKIFRIIHTIKGTCGFLGLPRLENLAHKTEDVLGLFREGTLTPEPELISVILDVLDEIKVILPAIAQTGEEPAGNDDILTTRLESIVSGYTGNTVDNEISFESLPDRPPETDNAHNAEIHHDKASVAAQSLRVNVDVLENLMTMVSELVLTRNQLLQISRQSKDNAYATPLQRLNLVVSDLQEGVMKTRMQPVGNAWAKLPRIVRDMCHDLGKKIDIEMYGQDTELDRQVLEKIRDPLTHMIRNSADHGIETPDVRRAAGKPETGKIVLRSYHQGGHIMIELSDDGRGLNLDRIRAKIIEKKLIDEDQLALLSPQQIQQYIFHPGFSTAEKITAVSGRGVGMDVVRFNIEKIGGSIEMRSTEGAGTHFTIKIPLTLAIVSALIIETGADRFAIPQLSVSELVLINGDSRRNIEYVNDAQVLRLRGNLLPLIDLKMLVGGAAPSGDNNESRYVVVTKVAQFMFGIIVDNVYDLEEIVVKPVTRLLKNLPLFSGNTILGDGQVIMILDPSGILKVSGIGDMIDSLQSRETTDQVIAPEGPELPLLLFRAGDDTLKAAPLHMIARLEKLDMSELEYSDGQPVIKYLGRLMPVYSMDNLPASGDHPLIIFKANDRLAGLVVREIIDINSYHGDVQESHSPHLSGAIILDGHAVDIVDPAWYTHNGAANALPPPLDNRMAAE